VVQVRQIPSYIICGSKRCGSLKSEGFGDGSTALGALPSPPGGGCRPELNHARISAGLWRSRPENAQPPALFALVFCLGAELGDPEVAESGLAVGLHPPRTNLLTSAGASSGGHPLPPAGHNLIEGEQIGAGPASVNVESSSSIICLPSSEATIFVPLWLIVISCHRYAIILCKDMETGTVGGDKEFTETDRP